ncbi:hypothetical protein QKW35_15250 [Pontibacterium granulatum]|uniref:hypothetical protein n=1 Tax=Pontibacterium granulatum TaxID=2036029 RepID=UPI00249C42E9|nr:hypothetical protein [Pontibacterium granulatum]MDI3325735.1 hypothetical protein [Pontibacterium granulatum]
MNNIATITFHYDPIEDRILLVGNFNNNQPRCDFWLTRNITLKLLGALSTLVQKNSNHVASAPSEHQSGLAQFEHEQAQVDMQLQPEPQLRKKGVPGLLYKVDVSHQGQRYQVRFYEHGNDVATAQAQLTHKELHQVLSLLHRGALELDWGVDDQLFDPLTPASALQ